MSLWLACALVAGQLDGGLAFSNSPPSRPVAAVPAAAFPDYVALRQRRFVENIACGPLALLTVLKHYEVPVSEDIRREILNLAGDSGTDLLTIKGKTRELGLHAVGLRASPENLRRLGLPCIAYLSGRGFAAVTAYRPQAFLLTLPGDEPRWVESEVFGKRLGAVGVALLISTSPIDERAVGRPAEALPAAGPKLEFQSSLIAVGKIHGADWRREVTVVNRGDKPLEIAAVEVSCSCMKADVDLETIPAGEDATLTVTGSQSEYGQFLRSVAIATNDPVEPVATIKVSGFREPEFLFPQPELLVQTVAGQPFSATARFLTAADGLVEELTVEGLPDGLDASCAFRLGPTGEGMLSIESPGLPSPGWQNFTLRVVRAGQKVSDGSALHVGIEVMPALDVFPSQIRLRSQELHEAWSRRIRISTPLVGGLDDLTCDLPDPRLSAAMTAVLEPDELSAGQAAAAMLVLSGKWPDACRVLAGTAGVVRIECEAGSVEVEISCEEFD